MRLQLLCLLLLCGGIGSALPHAHAEAPPLPDLLSVHDHEPEVRLGVYLDSRFAGKRGVRIHRVRPGSAAAAAGLVDGDVLISLDKWKVNNQKQLEKAKKHFASGDRVKIRYLRDGKKRKTRLVFQASSSSRRAYLGINLRDSDAFGVVITQVNPQSAAANFGLRKGDRLVQIDQHEVADYNGLKLVMSVYAPGDKVKVRYFREGKRKKRKVILGSRT